MLRTPRTKWELRLVNLSFVVLFLTAVGLLQWLSREYHLRLDLTRHNRHSLSEASVAAVERLKEPLTITAFAGGHGALRGNIRELIGRYQKYKPDIQLVFVDPDTSPEQVREAGVQHEGELRLEYSGARENIAPSRLNEENLTNAFTRLGHRGERWLVFLSGHGERSPDRQANFDLSLWADQLRRRGFKTRALALGEHPRIPQNTTALVIAGPRARLLRGEVGEIEKYLERGGNLLWLADPGPRHGLERLAETLGIEFLPGTVVDPASEAITGNAAAVVVAKYGPHPVVRNFADMTLFPHAVALQLNAPKGWHGAILLDTHPSAWAETGALNGKIEFDKGKDIRGPLNLGVGLTRPREENREQRVVVLGDGDFLSNRFLGNAGNLDFGMSLVNWLSQNDAYVNIPVRVARDRRLDLSPTALAFLGGVFRLALPLLLIGGGLTVWLRRRKR
jgi:ABC-type uncharacterized transport system involved in gliding motility auxiliary subunit